MRGVKAPSTQANIRTKWVSDVWKQRQGVGVVVTGVGSWELRYQVPDFVTIFVSPSKPLCSGYSGFVYRARLSGWLVG